ncbi:MAG: hypothetical protein ACRD3I_05665 [Terriglobales bacterium]
MRPSEFWAMTPREVGQYLQGQRARQDQAERAAWQRAIVGAFHTERFARIKRLSGGDLKRALAPYEKGAMMKKPPQSEAQLWAVIRATHALVTRAGKGKAR